ncbi:dihydropteroate synthase [Dongia soli]|uniref:Dihydropteroate synthase n=1 Tax=Dongia soli TaxID=600628 RepID=A0ABU5EC64_9PROT|nr:dihydropteroate synthase [Dongia soli]MDY0883374.1 dihydropteroate synthase [Dongia soli]
MAPFHLIPTGLVSGEAAARAVAAGDACPLAGEQIAFTTLTQLSRAEDGTGRRQAMSLRAAKEKAASQLAALSAPRRPWAGFDLARPLIMGIINVTPDSFSDGGDNADAATAIRFGEQLLEAGADILDVGGESTRPGSEPVSPQDEIARVVPVIRTLAEKGAVISIDTRHAAVMEAAVAAGARIINDVTALTGDPDSQMVAAKAGADLVLMHMQGEPQTMQRDPHYADVTLDLLDYFAARLKALRQLGIDASKVSLDPGIGFGKNDQHNMRLMAELAAFHAFGCAITLGVSRKSFVGRFSRKEPPKQRVAGSLAAGLAGIARGVQILRVHDVAETYQAIVIWQAVSA